MKKIILSAIVILGFGAYALNQHLANQRSVVQVSFGDDTTQTDTITPTPEDATTPTPLPTDSDGSTIPTPAPTPTPTSSGLYKNGTYTGTAADAFYGNIQVQVTVSAGKISNIKFLQYPDDRDQSAEINTHAMPLLAREAISAQAANVQIISGATQSSEAFVQSLSSALSQARNS